MSENIQSISSITTKFLDQPPSCLEFCPDDPDYFMIGTYLLEEDKEGINETATVKQTKTGSLQLWHLDITKNEIDQKQVLSLPYAVFDLQFHPRQPTLLGIASSDGSVALYRVSREVQDTNPHVQHIWTRSVHEEPSIPALFLAWAPHDWFLQSGAAADGFAVTFSDGRTSIFALPSGRKDIACNEPDLVETQFLPRENIEAWFVALATYAQPGSEKPFSYSFMGNDFGSLNVRKFACSEDTGSDDDIALEELKVSDTDDRARHHTAGVTSILPLPTPMIQNAPVVLTGSYDEYTRVYHATTRGAVLAEEQLGGGVWRLRLIRTEEGDSETTFLVLASCMHAGTRVLRVVWKRGDPGLLDIGEWEIRVLGEFTEHESMNYASGVREGVDAASQLVCVSSSFYDKRLCLWKVDV
ncbi:hypothetical protein BGW36DRAFT_300403 [Talaromyces proteolyticus]|uniref:Diphthine methyltransferase n=1 Tax=Talaromyces proteolyticus TaxID=1131652 RepID=A0AAD4KLQ5_9EURO|nr:uncharacterized protein BGW36DRAFT_300403 [Talaromyces proteolyticus]KAH8693966.1 hypothetical protein BGW36DRAFT_300403 [Talaromyces proteolyticus]